MLAPVVPCTLLVISYRVANCPPAEWPATTILVRFGKTSLSESLRMISSTKSNEEIVGFVGDIPPDRHEFWPSGHTTSLADGLSCPAMNRGAMMIVLSSAPARKPAAVLVSK